MSSNNETMANQVDEGGNGANWDTEIGTRYHIQSIRKCVLNISYCFLQINNQEYH